MQVALTYNLKTHDANKPPDYSSEFDSQDTIDAIMAALRSRGHQVRAVNVAQPNIYSYFRNNRVDIVFNIAEGNSGKFRESEIPALLDYLNIPYTGSTPFSLALALNKNLTKKILLAENIPTPHFQVFEDELQTVNSDLRFPLIAKPNREGSAKGIDASCVVRDRMQLRAKIRELRLRYAQEVLVEEFIEGKELTVGILEHEGTVILPVLEIDFSTCSGSGEFFYSWRMKEFQGNHALGLTPTFHCPARLDKETERKVKEVALRTHHAIGCLDMSRTDIRLSADGTPYVLEVNPLPGLNPQESNFPLMAYAAGMTYEQLIERILVSALQRRRAYLEQ